MASQTSKIKVIDSTMGGEARPLPHSIYAIVYAPSWLRLRYGFKWDSTTSTAESIDVMRSYFIGGPLIERPIRAQRCLYSLKALHVYGYSKSGFPRFSTESQGYISALRVSIGDYLEDNPVVAWDWIVSWSECGAMAEAYPKELIRLYRRLRSHRDIKKQPKPELAYFLNIIETTAKEKGMDMEWKY